VVNDDLILLYNANKNFALQAIFTLGSNAASMESKALPGCIKLNCMQRALMFQVLRCCNSFTDSMALPLLL
jgi:hypothetical protein